jgi:hypothetical protein
MRSVALLLVALTSRAAAEPTRFWVTPIERVLMTAGVVDESTRPYDTPLHPRRLIGNLALSCEHVEGRPCGTVAFTELDSRAGYGDRISFATRLRSASDHLLELDRAHVDVHHRYARAKLGRDIVYIGPTARTPLLWGDHPPPLDHARIDVTHSHVSGLYLIGRLREPQRFPGTLVTIGRGQLDFSSVSLGVVHMLELEGDGARQLGFVDFILEHVRRKDITAGETDSSNRRFGGDISLRVSELRARLYYILIFEDIRKARFIDAFRYDADHLLGIDTPWATVEWHATAARSHEHTSRTTGFTNGGYVVGSPLGPDARSLYVSARIRNLRPWFELVQLRNRMIEYIEYGPITPKSAGEDEGRYRVGVRADFALPRYLTLEVEAMYEHVDDYAFEPHATRNNGGVRATLVWLPRF